MKEIPFTQEMLRKTRNKSKIHTLRRKKYGVSGDILKISDGEDYIKLISVRKYPLEFVAEYLFECEGCHSKDHFIAVWENIHPDRGYVPEDIYLGHFYVYLGCDVDIEQSVGERCVQTHF